MTDYRLLSPKAALVVLTLLTAVFRIHALFANSFHADEALFASWARLIAVWRDPLLQTVAVDKPPLLFYAQALFFPLLGPVEWAARLPNLIASILLVPLVAVWVWRWYRDGKTAVFAAALVALSPLHIQFSATAFTDPLLTTLLVGALLVSGRPTKNKKQKTKNNVASRPLRVQQISGLFFGLAAATKHQAWLFLPLVVGTAVLSCWGWREWRRWLTGFLPMLGLVTGWEIARTGPLSLWAQQMSNFGGLRLIWSWELWPRLQSWWGLMQTLWGWGITAVFLVMILIWLVASFKNNRTQINADDADEEKKSLAPFLKMRRGRTRKNA
ncbi:MAG: glycosyltransferase family 39 protein, partial [Anaerolineales bacterium]|nr:glycosyltransferase family 39 protein [Anaerolineales bacterium]